MSLITLVQDLATRVGTEFKTLRTTVFGTAAGGLELLHTTDRSSLVAAINEARTTGGSEAPEVNPATEAVAGIVRFASTAQAVTGEATDVAVTPAGLRAGVDAGVARVVGAAPAALDTLEELAARLEADASGVAAINEALGFRVRVDAAQAFSGGQQAQGRANIGAQSAAEIGDTSVDLVAVFEAALV